MAVTPGLHGPTRSPQGIVWHLPHDATAIPEEVRGQFVLGDQELATEVLRMTDHFTGQLFGLDLGNERVIRVPVSRLVVDVERFPEDRDEPMAAGGMGVIYNRTSEGRPLRRPITERERQALLERWYWPHHRRLEGAVERALVRTGQCLLIDCHSFPSQPLPYETDQSPDRPDICLGTDEFHTPAVLVEATITAFRREGFNVAVDRPFSGALVPLSRYRRDGRVSALMVEVNRRLYLDERTVEWSAAGESTSERLKRVLQRLVTA
nr:N-formylglutamate amidohydrolase [Wenzhouxiangella limi]